MVQTTWILSIETHLSLKCYTKFLQIHVQTLCLFDNVKYILTDLRKLVDDKILAVMECNVFVLFMRISFLDTTLLLWSQTLSNKMQTLWKKLLRYCFINQSEKPLASKTTKRLQLNWFESKPKKQSKWQPNKRQHNMQHPHKLQPNKWVPNQWHPN